MYWRKTLFLTHHSRVRWRAFVCRCLREKNRNRERVCVCVCASEVKISKRKFNLVLIVSNVQWGAPPVHQPASLKSSAPWPNAVFIGSVTSYDNLMTTLPESSISPIFHLQTGDDLAAYHASTERPSPSRTSSSLIWYWRMSQCFAKFMWAGGSRWFPWDQSMRIQQ